MFHRDKWVSKYKRLKKLGQGTYGVVYKAEHTSSKEIVAVKQIYVDEDNEGIPSTAIREIALLKSLDHPHIIKLKETIYHNDNLYLVFPYFDSDLKKYFNSKKDKIPMHEITDFVYQILLATNHCHSKRIYHRDLKPQNILIDERTKQIKLADFGLSRTFTLPNQTWTHEVITLWYRSPEILLGMKHYTHTSDLWSIGCIFGEFCNKSVPLFRGDSEICQVQF